LEPDLICPRCAEKVLGAGDTAGQHYERHERATCPQCKAELVRHPELDDNAWKVEESPPLADEELGGGD
jgi:hypothetical protein